MGSENGAWLEENLYACLLEAAFYPFSHYSLYLVYTLLTHENSGIIIIVRLRI